MRIIDIHAHVFPDKIAQRASDSIGTFYDLRMDADGTLTTLLQKEEAAGVAHACIHSVAITARNVQPINSFIASAVLQTPERLTGFAAIHPDYPDLPGLLDEVKKLGLKGFKIHPDMQHFALDEPKVMDMFAMIEGQLPIIIHTGDPRYQYSNPPQMKKVLDAFPHLQCVCAHLGGWGEWVSAVETLSGYENVWVDTSSSLYAISPEQAVRVIRGYNPERVLFGTDYPMWDPKKELERFERLPLTLREKEAILEENPTRFLNLA